MAATLPVTTRVLIGRVAVMPSKCDKDTGSDPISGMFGKRNMYRGSYTSNVCPLKMLSLYLKSHYLHLSAIVGKESGNQVQPATLPVTTRVLIGIVAGMPSKCDKTLVDASQ
jgi:hypothetical protein